MRLGAPLLRALFPRAYLDVNREPYELDPQVFEGRLPDFANTRSLRVAVGLGTIPRVVGDSQPIYKQPISVAEGLGRIEWLYRPYHEQLRALVERALRRFGRAVLIDCHSMPSNAADVAGLDVVLGDRYGASAAPGVVEILETSLRAAGYRVRRNKPFAGGFITENFGAPSRGVDAVQIEIARVALSRRAQAGEDRGVGQRCAAICSTRSGVWRASSAAITAVWRPSDGAGGDRCPQTSTLRAAAAAGEAPTKKGGRHVATAAFSLGRKRPRRAYAAGHAAPQQYRRCASRLARAFLVR